MSRSVRLIGMMLIILLYEPGNLDVRLIIVRNNPLNIVVLPIVTLLCIESAMSYSGFMILIVRCSGLG